ncbi:hypothetical protein WMF28_09215 [Sorangium sp. So ce590]|uniref:hypothetical protein n=1 Tax=Sorangium sp. So ce590 TaxID=3133317 RepID=UPI003F5FA5AD
MKARRREGGKIIDLFSPLHAFVFKLAHDPTVCRADGEGARNGVAALRKDGH